MRTPADVRQFIREVLGCKCPGGVFERFSLERGREASADGPYQWRLVIGERLLIYVAPLPDSGNLSTWLDSLRSAGIRDRDSAALNRFRAVVLVGEAGVDPELWQRARGAWALHPCTHLHPVPAAIAQRLLASLDRCVNGGKSTDPA